MFTKNIEIIKSLLYNKPNGGGNYEIKTWISGINKDGGVDTSTGGTRRATDEEIDALVEEGVITWEEGERLKKKKKISLNL
mgnify:CR=1 FL=1